MPASRALRRRRALRWRRRWPLLAMATMLTIGLGWPVVAAVAGGIAYLQADVEQAGMFFAAGAGLLLLQLLLAI
jgi:hypothetical protein